MNDKGDKLVADIFEGRDVDAIAPVLLEEFFDGYEIDRLALLLESGNEDIVKAGAWIASELGSKAYPVLSQCAALLNYPSRHVRSYAVDVVLVNATSENGSYVAIALLLILDRDPGVRWKALWFISRLADEQLQASLPYIDHDKITALATWLLSIENTFASKQDIIFRLSQSDPETRLFAVAAASRLSKYDRSVLEHALLSSDSEVSSFAKEELWDAVHSARRSQRRLWTSQ